MEEDTQTNVEVSVMEATTMVENIIHPIQENRKTEEKENSLHDGEFIKVDRETSHSKEPRNEELKKIEELEMSNEELKKKVAESERKVVQSLSENELLMETNLELKSKIDELQRLLSTAAAEKEASSVQLSSHVDTITELTDKHSRSIELHTVAEEQLKETRGKLAEKETEVTELSEKLDLFETRMKKYEEAAREASKISESRIVEIERLQEAEVKDLNERLESRKVEIEEITDKLSQKELEVKELSEKLAAIEGYLKSHLEEAREIAESRKVEKEQWRATMEKLAQKELEATELIAQVSALENRVRTYQEEAGSREVEMEETLLKLGQIETRNEALAEANMKLTQDLALSESDQSDLHAKLSQALEEKDSLAVEYELSKKTIKDLTRELGYEKQRLQSEISAALEESSQLHEGKNKLGAAIVQLEEQIQQYKENEQNLRSELQNLMAEVSEKSVMQARLSELEGHYQTTEAQLKEVKSLHTAATTREADLTSQLQQHVQKLQDRDLLNERVSHLERELQFAETTITKLEEENSAKVSELETERSQTSAELEAKSKEVVLLGKKVEDLEKKLQEVEATSKQKGNEKNEAATQAEVRSRDIDSMLSPPAKRKSSKSEKSSAQPSSSSAAQTSTTIAAPAASMNVKFILGVALVSIIVGVILGKRY